MSKLLDAWIEYEAAGRVNNVVRYVIPVAAMELIIAKMKDDEKHIVYLQGIIEGLRRGESSK